MSVEWDSADSTVVPNHRNLLRRVIGVDRITRLCQPSVSGAIVLRGGARSGCCRAARSGRQAAWRLGLSSWWIGGSDYDAGAHRASSCSDFSTCASVGAHRISSCCNRSMCAKTPRLELITSGGNRDLGREVPGSAPGEASVESVQSNWCRLVGGIMLADAD